MYGLTPTGLAWAALACLLIAQFWIDFDTQLLPDDLNYLILWLGLIASAMGWTTVPLASSVWGAVFGYLSLWSVYQVHHRLTGKQGMGHGDFKLLAGLGAWFGAEYLVALILLSSVVGSILGGALAAGRQAGQPGHSRFRSDPFWRAPAWWRCWPDPAGSRAWCRSHSRSRTSPDDLMLRLGLTGGIGSGKSTVAELFALQGAVLIDADAISRATTAAGGPAIAADRRGIWRGLHRGRWRAGPRQDAPGQFLRPCSARQAGGHRPSAGGTGDRHGAKRPPRPLARAASCSTFLCWSNPAAGASGSTVCWSSTVSPEVQISRVMARSGLTREEVEKIIASQASRKERLRAADIVMFNAGPPREQIAHEVKQIARRLGL